MVKRNAGCIIFALALPGVFSVVFLQGANAQQNAGNQHEHEAHDEPAHEDHQGEEHDEHGHDAHEKGVVHLNDDQLSSLKLEHVRPRTGALETVIELPGEVQWNTDRIAHVTPRVSGIVAQVEKTLGDRVAAGDRLCVLDSREIGDAKMEYLTDRARFDVAEADFARAGTVHDNTKKLLAILDNEPTLGAALTGAHDLPVGENKNKLLTAYTRMKVDATNLQRVQDLFAAKIASDRELMEARGDYEVARADYISTREEIAFDLELAFLRAQKDFQVARTEMRNAERALHLLGLTNEQTQQIALHGEEIDEDISRAALFSPITGIVVDRHLTRGELVDTTTKLYTIADLSDVWVMGRVYERDIRFLAVGQKASIRLDSFPDETFEGTINYIGSELDPATRTVEARVVLPNPQRRFRPGMFGTVSIFSESERADSSATPALVVPLSCVQRLPNGHAVFRFVTRGRYEVVPVHVVAQNHQFAQVLGELAPDDQLASGDTFILKSQAQREAMGGGHSH